MANILQFAPIVTDAGQCVADPIRYVACGHRGPTQPAGQVEPRPRRGTNGFIDISQVVVGRVRVGAWQRATPDMLPEKSAVETRRRSSAHHFPFWEHASNTRLRTPHRGITSHIGLCHRSSRVLRDCSRHRGGLRFPQRIPPRLRGKIVQCSPRRLTLNHQRNTDITCHAAPRTLHREHCTPNTARTGPGAHPATWPVFARPTWQTTRRQVADAQTTQGCHQCLSLSLLSHSPLSLQPFLQQFSFPTDCNSSQLTPNHQQLCPIWVDLLRDGR